MKSNLIAKIANHRFPNRDHIHEELKHRPDIQKTYHDKTAHDLPALVPGQHVRMWDNQTGKWKPATILSKCTEPRSYILKLPDGSSKRRNRVHIRADGKATHKHVHFSDQTQSQSGLPNTSISNQINTKKHAPNITRHGREIHRPNRFKQ